MRSRWQTSASVLFPTASRTSRSNLIACRRRWLGLRWMRACAQDEHSRQGGGDRAAFIGKDLSLEASPKGDVWLAAPSGRDLPGRICCDPIGDFGPAERQRADRRRRSARITASNNHGSSPSHASPPALAARQLGQYSRLVNSEYYTTILWLTRATLMSWSQHSDGLVTTRNSCGSLDRQDLPCNPARSSRVAACPLTTGAAQSAAAIASKFTPPASRLRRGYARPFAAPRR